MIANDADPREGGAVARGTRRCSSCRLRPVRASQPRGGWCNVCHATYMREHRPAHTDLPPEELRRARVRGYASVYQRRGLLVPQPCEVCGSADVEKHHEDYDYPLLVRWRCREHHLDLHYTWRPLRRRERPTPRLPFEASPQLGLF